MRAFTDGKNINPQWSPDGQLAVLHRGSRRHPEPLSRDRGDRRRIAGDECRHRVRAASPPRARRCPSPHQTGVASFSVYEERQVRHLHAPAAEPFDGGNPRRACRRAIRGRAAAIRSEDEPCGHSCSPTLALAFPCSRPTARRSTSRDCRWKRSRSRASASARAGSARRSAAASVCSSATCSAITRSARWSS